jgi:raffinose/stachyose/melibiose transport system substrate-binding protein
VDLFKQLGLSIPTSFSQVLSLCQRINAAGKVPFAAGWKDVSTANIWVPHRAAQYVFNTNPTWNVDRAKGKTTFATSPSWQQALQSIVAMKESNCFQPGAQGSARAQAYTMFGLGNAAMIVIAAAELPNIVATNPAFKYELFNLPGDNPKTAIEYAPTSVGIGANAATQHPDQVKTFLAFITREQQSRLYAKVGGGIAPLDLKKALLPAYMAPISALIKAGRYDGSHHGGWPNVRVFDEALAPCVLGLMTGQTTVASCLAAADTAWDSGR